MKNRIVILFCSLWSISACIAQGVNYQILMPAINPQYADSVFPPIYFPPINPYIPGQGNGSRTLANPGYRSSPTTTITDLGDVIVMPTSDIQTEPHLTINKNHPNNIIISCNYDFAINFVPQPPLNPYGTYKHDQSIFISNNFNSQGSWSQIQFYPPGGLQVKGDPSTAVDADGNLFVSSINSNADDYWLTKSNDLGLTWQGFSTSNPLDGNASGPLSSPPDFDKEMIVSDNLASSPYKNNVYCAWMYNHKDCQSPTFPHAYPVLFNKLDVVNGATSFDTPIYLSHRFGQGANVKTSRDGHIFVCWADYDDHPCIDPQFHPARHIGFTKSLDGGNTFQPDPSNPSKLYQINYNGIRMGTAGRSEYNVTKVNDFPSMAVDRSCGGQFTKRIYITYPEFDPIVSFKSRIVVIYSDNEGFSWTKANINLNSNGFVDVNGALNWMPWITVDDATGNVYVAYISAVNMASGGLFPADVYLAYSVDGGDTFDNIKVSDHSFTPIGLPDPNSIPPGPFQEGYWGDYISLDAYGGNVYVAWMSNYNAQLNWQYNIFCSKLTVSTPLTYSSFQDLPINGPLTMTNSQSTILYEAVNSVSTIANSESITIENGANATFKAGNFIQFKPGSAINNFGCLSGSLTHAYIDNVANCTTPFRRGNVLINNQNILEETQDNIFISPNPFTNIFDINYSVFSDNIISIKLFDSFGRKTMDIVKEQYTLSGNYNVTVNMPSLNSGLYFIIFYYENKITTKRLLKL